ncbi:MAG: endolytic transglycosylase MltG [Thermoleophilia bacterium]|nr:endolytic transglycosylase MltG [Thermoleophilia bacterium]
MHDRRRQRRNYRRAKARRRQTVAWMVLIIVLAIGVGWALAGPRLSSDTPTEAEREAAGLQTVNVTFPEGLRREDVARIVDEQTAISAADYLAATAAGPEGRSRAKAKEPTSLEGYLFPATYEVNKLTTAEDLVQRQLDAFDDSTAGVDYSYARERNLTPHEVLSIAAMVEREVRVPEEREIVAGVIYNRLRNRMLLGIDATVQYAIGEWKQDLSSAELQNDSPYNTRKFFGLPPGPIASPGVASIVAAARPQEHEFLYYVAKADGSGGHYFARDEAEFEQQVARARANAG